MRKCISQYIIFYSASRFKILTPVSEGRRRRREIGLLEKKVFAKSRLENICDPKCLQCNMTEDTADACPTSVYKWHIFCHMRTGRVHMLPMHTCAS